jgi:hypothetical protein
VGESSSSDELTADSGSGPEGIDERLSLISSFGENQSQSNLGLFQQYPPQAAIP